MSKKTLTITLKDQCADVHLKTIKVKLLSEGGKLWIRPKGYSDKCSADGHGYPVGLEIWQGRLRLIVFNDINMEEPQIIDLENARESNRDSGDITMSHLKKRFVLVVDGRELATILAALRFHQDENLQGCSDIADQAIKEIATNSGSLKPLDFNEVGKLCERVNTCEEAHSGHQKEVCVLAVMNKNMVVHTQAYNSRFRAEKAMLDYLRSYEGYKGKDNVAEACDWLAKQEGTLKVDICSTQVDCQGASPPLGLTIAPPPKDSGEESLFRVVYVIDVNAGDIKAAAEYTHQIMVDPNSMLPVLQVIDHTGKTVTVDLSENRNHIQKENHRG